LASLHLMIFPNRCFSKVQYVSLSDHFAEMDAATQAKERMANESSANPQISVVMGVYGGLDALPTTLKSITEQTFGDFEIVLVDDGNPIDVHQQILEISQYDQRIRVIRMERNQGLTQALIVGCKAARGDFIARIDNGDLMIPPNRLSLQVQALKNNPDSVLVAGGVIYVDLVNKQAYRSRGNRESVETISNSSVDKLRIVHVTVMMRREKYLACGGYNPEYKTGQDGDLWPRILSLGNGLRMGELFAVAPMRLSSISVKENNRQLKEGIKRECAKLKTNRLAVKPYLLVTKKLIQLMIPVRLRMIMRYRKNFKVIKSDRPIPGDIAELATWIRNHPEISSGAV
jgi:glycosyltransferase involved in cell wall biosynthesis